MKILLEALRWAVVVLLIASCGDDGTTTSQVRRLTRTEYDNAVRDLLGDATRPAQALSPDERAHGFESNVRAPVDEVLARGYTRIAERLATEARLDELLPCDPAAGSACAREFIESFGRRAFRRPLTAPEQERYLALFSSPAAEGDFDTGVRLVIQAVLGSPQFLYKIEPVGGEGPLGQYEIASRLSFLLWSSVPDDELLQAAERGELATDEQLASQTERMLDDPRARSGLLYFFEQWLELRRLESAEKVAAMFPAFDMALRASMQEEVRRYLVDWFWSGDATLSALLTSSRTSVDAALAAHYGLAVDAQAGWVTVDLDPAQRAGILTLSGVLTMLAKPDSSSPVARGKFVRSQFLCSMPPSPPPGAEFNLPPPSPSDALSTRERFAQHVSDARCAGCHQMMDPIGFGFENYDAVGAYRADEAGIDVDSTGELTGSGDADGFFEGGVELAHRLARSTEVRRCVATQWFRFASGRSETADDAGALEALVARFEASGGDFRALIMAYTTSDEFRRRAPRR